MISVEYDNEFQSVNSNKMKSCRTIEIRNQDVMHETERKGELFKAEKQEILTNYFILNP